MARFAVTVGAAVFCSRGTGLSVAVLEVILEVVPFVELDPDVATRPVEGTVSEDPPWVARLVSSTKGAVARGSAGVEPKLAYLVCPVFALLPPVFSVCCGRFG